MDPMGWIVLIIALVFIAICIFLSFVPLGLWISALASGVHVSIGSLVGMKIRRVQPKRLVSPLIKARKAGLNVTINQLKLTCWPVVMSTASSTPSSPLSAPTSTCPSRRPAPSTWLAATCSRPCR